MSHQEELTEGEVQRTLAKSLASRGLSEQEINNRLDQDADDIGEELSKYLEEVENYELEDYQQERLDIASNAELVVGEAAKFADVSENVAIDYLSRNGDLKTSEGEKTPSGFRDEELKIALEGFYYEWKNRDEIAEKVSEEGDSPYERSSDLIREKMSEVDGVEMRPPNALEREKDRLAELRGEDETRFRVSDVTATNDTADYTFSNSVYESSTFEKGLVEATTDYEVIDEIEDEELVAWLQEQGLSENEQITAMIADFDRDPGRSIDQNEDREITSGAKDLLESLTGRGELNYT